jgi:hypothetical protein
MELEREREDGLYRLVRGLLQAGEALEILKTTR